MSDIKTWLTHGILHYDFFIENSCRKHTLEAKLKNSIMCYMSCMD